MFSHLNKGINYRDQDLLLFGANVTQRDLGENRLEVRRFIVSKLSDCVTGATSEIMLTDNNSTLLPPRSRIAVDNLSHRLHHSSDSLLLHLSNRDYLIFILQDFEQWERNITLNRQIRIHKRLDKHKEHREDILDTLEFAPE